MKQRDEAQLQVNEKDRQLSELRREVNNVIDKKKRLEHELERLKQHLVQVEEGYTQEALQSEDRERELRKKLQVNLYFLKNFIVIKPTYAAMNFNFAQIEYCCEL